MGGSPEHGHGRIWTRAGLHGLDFGSIGSASGAGFYNIHSLVEHAVVDVDQNNSLYLYTNLHPLYPTSILILFDAVLKLTLENRLCLGPISLVHPKHSRLA